MGMLVGLVSDIHTLVHNDHFTGRAITHSLQTLTSFSSLLDLHYDLRSGMFLDYGYHTEDLELKRKMRENGQGAEMVRSSTFKGASPSYSYVPHFGYVSLFPLISGLIPTDSEELGTTLTLLRDEKHLWTKHGLRSLSVRLRALFCLRIKTLSKLSTCLIILYTALHLSHFTHN